LIKKARTMASTVFKWAISEFSTKVPRNGDSRYILSDMFELGESGIDFFLEMFSGIQTGDGHLCAIDLNACRFEEDGLVNVQFKMWLENIYGKKLLDQPLVKTYEFVCEGDCIRDDLIPNDQLYSSDFLKNDIVLVCCEILFIAKVEKNRLSFDLAFREKLHSLYKQDIGDFVLEAEGRKFNVSKVILMANSEVFERMLMSETRESKENVVKIEDVSASIMEKFVDYLYLGELDGLDDFAEDIFVLADRYLVESLKTCCKLSLVNSLSENNIVSRLQFAFKRNYADLKVHTLFYAKGIFHRIVESDAWKKLGTENRDLAYEICLSMFKF